jgi:hypothetical protein
MVVRATVPSKEQDESGVPSYQGDNWLDEATKMLSHVSENNLLHPYHAQPNESTFQSTRVTSMASLKSFGAVVPEKLSDWA